MVLPTIGLSAFTTISTWYRRASLTTGSAGLRSGSSQRDAAMMKAMPTNAVGSPTRPTPQNCMVAERGPVPARSIQPREAASRRAAA